MAAPQFLGDLGETASVRSLITVVDAINVSLSFGWQGTEPFHRPSNHTFRKCGAGRPYGYPFEIHFPSSVDKTPIEGTNVRVDSLAGFSFEWGLRYGADAVACARIWNRVTDIPPGSFQVVINIF